MFRMPAEWAPHERCWMAWPCRHEVWGDRLEAVKAGYAAVAHAIARFEPVSMIVTPASAPEARNHLGSGITLVEMPADDSWTRDSGPCFVSNGNELRAVCFGFNAWGNKYAPYDQDAQMARRIARHCGIPVIASDLVAEGGGISVDGEGTVLTTRSCFPNANRNPAWSMAQITDELKNRLGVEKVVWLPGNAHETETDGHVDGIAQFAGPGRVIVETTADRHHPWCAIMQENIEALRQSTDAKGRPFELVFICEAESLQVSSAHADRFCRSYVNFYLANSAVIAPSYGIREDDAARDVLGGSFPDREVVQVPINDIAIGGGGIHCITQQQPKIII